MGGTFREKLGLKMSQLSKLKAKEGEKTILGMTEEEWKRMGRPLAHAVQKIPGSIGVNLDNFNKWEAEKANQPFKTNELLEELQKGQPPKWVAYVTLGAAILAVIFALWSPFK